LGGRVRIRTVMFDVGETLLSEGRTFAAWADWMGIQRHVFIAVLGAVIGSGGDGSEVFERLRPGFDRTLERARRAEAGMPDAYGAEDVYPDVQHCLSTLAEQGVEIGIAGERSDQADPVLRSLGLPVGLVADPDLWNIRPSSPWFYARLVIESGMRAGELLFVGDRVDADIRPAQEAGLQTAFIRRGPWGYIQDHAFELRHCLFRLDSLASLPELVAEHNATDST
jgi:FMN phosphatase YigB (HAD superfamily)